MWDPRCIKHFTRFFFNLHRNTRRLPPLSLCFDNEVTEAQRYKSTHSRSLNGNQRNGGLPGLTPGLCRAWERALFLKASLGIHAGRGRALGVPEATCSHRAPSWYSASTNPDLQPHIFRDEWVLGHPRAGLSSYTGEEGEKGYFPRSHKIIQMGREVWELSLTFSSLLRSLPKAPETQHQARDLSQLKSQQVLPKEDLGLPCRQSGLCNGLV